MSDLRKEFEVLPEIKAKLISVRFNAKLNKYESVSVMLTECVAVTLFVNGAWYAFQEQQKRIDVVSSKINELISNYSMRIDPFNQDVNIANNEFIGDLKELLK